MKSSEVFFTSDTHFGHKKMAALRGFADVDEMNERMVEVWNSIVPRTGVVYHMGDVSFMSKAKTQALLYRLNGSICLVRGNHDGDSTTKTTRFMWVRDYYELKVEDTDVRIIMCHYAFRVWNMSHYGTWNLHGHSHGNLPPIGGQMDVGVDTNRLSPYTYAAVAANMRVRGSFVPVDHHKEPT